MYLRRVRFRDGHHYVIRESVSGDGCWKYNDLMDLGHNPEAYIKYSGGNGFFFSEALQERLQAYAVKYSSEELERLFMPFLDPRIRNIIENFQTHGTIRNGLKRYSEGELLLKQGQLHAFDKRRMHFLRCGRVDIGDLDGRPWKFLNVLMEKCRDEIEHIIEGMEGVLHPHEMRSYLFTALHLQSHFSDHLLCNHPHALDREKMDEYFLDALCRLNNDQEFFAGVEWRGGTNFHQYLSKYLILYFDSGFEASGWRPDYIRDFLQGQQSFRSIPAGVKRMDVEAACKVLGLSEGDLTKLHRKELIRLYRKKAKEHHPDRGGNKESFILMTQAFECLLDKK